jgi:hypothetical protein
LHGSKLLVCAILPLVGTSLVKLVPAHHVYLQVLQRVDFSFVQPLVAPFCSAIGRPSLDPVVFVKLLIVQHLENITSRKPSTLSDS